MPRWTKLALKILSVILGLIILCYISIAIYVHSNKKKLLVTITKELNKRPGWQSYHWRYGCCILKWLSRCFDETDECANERQKLEPASSYAFVSSKT